MGFAETALFVSFGIIKFAHIELLDFPPSDLQNSIYIHMLTVLYVLLIILSACARGTVVVLCVCYQTSYCHIPGLHTENDYYNYYYY